MANIDRIVNVQISLNTAEISREGFSTGLIVGAHAHTLGRVQTYTSLDGMMNDGFTVADPIFQAANDYFAQIPKPKHVKIGRQKCAVELTVADIEETETYSVFTLTKDSAGNVTTLAYRYKNVGYTDVEDILTGIANLILADADAVVNPVIGGGTLTLGAKAGKDFAIKVSDNLSTRALTSTEAIAKTMAEIVAEDNDFYGIMLMSRRQIDIMAMAAWTEAHTKIFGTAINEDGAKDASSITDTGYLLQKNNYFRTFWFYHQDAENDYPECAVMARCFSILPGGETWANKRLAGVTPSQLTETEYLSITYKNGNTFEKFRNISITQNGKTAAGEWIDVIRFRDWLVEEISNRIFTLLVNNDKIPYTDAGITRVEAQIRSALELGQARGGIAPTEYDENHNRNLGFTVTVPLSSQISFGQKASRILEDVEFTARLAGAIHCVEVRGNLTYDNLIVDRLATGGVA